MSSYMSSPNQYTVTINAVGPKAPLLDGSKSTFGHVWYSVSDGNGKIQSFGFAPSKSGDPFGPGEPNPHGSDDENYLTRDYTRTINISKDDYEILKDFGQNPEKYGFSTYYNGVANSCIDYLWKGLEVIGLNPSGFQGDIFPLKNISNFNEIKSTFDDPNATQPDFEQKSTPEKDGKTVEKWISDLADDLGVGVDNMINSSKEFFSDLLGLEDNNFNVNAGDSYIKLADSGLIRSDALSPLEEAIISLKDNDGNEFSIVKDILVPLKDGTLIAVHSVINVINSAPPSLISFINHQIEGIFEPIFKELFSTDDSTKDTNGDNAAQRLAGKILADLIQGKDITQIANDTTSQVLIQNLLSDASKKLAASIPTGPLGADTAAFVQGTIAGAVINFAIAVAADRRMDLSDRACSHSQEWQNGGQNALRFERIAGMSFAYPRDEYGTAAAKALTSAAANDNFSTMEKLKIKREVRL